MAASVAVGGRETAVEMGTAEMAMSRVVAVARVAGQGIEYGGVEAEMTVGLFSCG